MTNLNLPRRWLSALDVSWLRMLLSAVCMLLVFELTPLDVWLADGYFVGGNFVGKGNWWLDVFSHKWVKWTMILLALLVWLKVLAGRLSPRWRQDQRRWLVGGLAMLLAPATVGVLKHFSDTHCPWDVLRYGGEAPYVKLLEWTPVADPGRCFPAGHAPTGFAFLAGYAWLRPVRPQAARWWLAATLAAGVVLGMAQQIRGAHFASHTLWTAWLCWACALLLHHWSRRPSATPAG